MIHSQSVAGSRRAHSCGGASNGKLPNRQLSGLLAEVAAEEGSARITPLWSVKK
jgi:hypothetical protein